MIIGGPPCQAYARVGRAKLREIAEHPQAFKIDPRANLYLRYLHYIEQLTGGNQQFRNRHVNEACELPSRAFGVDPDTVHRWNRWL